MEQDQPKLSIELVKQLEAQRDIEGLLALLTPGTSIILRRAAARSLALIAPPESVPSLSNFLLTEPDRGVRQSLVRALGRLGDDRGLEALLRTLKDPELMVREETAQALARSNSPVAFEALLKALQLKEDNQDWRVRRFAAESLGRLGDRRAVPALLESLRDPNNLVRPAVATALGQLGDREAISALKRARHNTVHQRGAGCAECEAIDSALKILQANQTEGF